MSKQLLFLNISLLHCFGFFYRALCYWYNERNANRLYGCAISSNKLQPLIKSLHFKAVNQTIIPPLHWLCHRKTTFFQGLATRLQCVVGCIQRYVVIRSDVGGIWKECYVCERKEGWCAKALCCKAVGIDTTQLTGQHTPRYQYQRPPVCGPRRATNAA